MNGPGKRVSARSALANLPGTTLVRTYVWEKPVRVAHWLIFFTFVSLSLTGLYIHRPFLVPAGEGSMLMARMRFVHEVSGFLLIAAMALRIYWFFRGNIWARWSAYLPIRREQWDGIGSMLEFYLFLRFLPRSVIGHNPLAAVAYLVIYLLIVVEIVTGLFLYARVLGNPTLQQAFGWLGVLVNPSYIRLVHYFLMFVFFSFVIFHVYASVLVSLEEENGLLDSIFSGWKFVPARELRHEVAATHSVRRIVRRHQLLPTQPAADARAAVPPGARPGPGPVTLYRNWISYIGTLMAGAGALVFVVLTAYHTIGGGELLQPYGDLVMFFVPPVFVIGGVVLVVLGMYVQWIRWRMHKPLAYGRYPKWDLNVNRERKALLATFLAAGVLVVPATYGSGRAYQYSDEVPFCGSVCHAMQPEYVTYQNSPHARVDCAACHIGPGVTGWVKAKARGMVELYAIASNDFPRPIPASDMARRPARGNCERCHWPQNRVEAREFQRTYFLADEQNTAWELAMTVPIDGVGPTRSGAHWHVDAIVEYVSADGETIPWVRAVDPVTRASTVYTVEGRSPAVAPPGDIRRMDCVDCHTRPSHRVTAPTDSVNALLAHGRISHALPYIKQQAVEVLTATYGSRHDAVAGIDRTIRGYYQKTYPQLYASHEPTVAAASASLQSTYDQTFFPEMKVHWRTYPTHDGHLNFPGCMRCHDGQLKSAAGRPVRSECSLCHQIQRQGPRGSTRFASAPGGLDFEHPSDIGDAWKTARCSDCHTGGSM